MKGNYVKNYDKRKWSVLNRKNIVWYFSFLILTLHIIIAVQTSSMGAKIALYEEGENRLKKENQELSMNLIDSTSLTKLDLLSGEMGFKKIENTLYLQTGDSFAKAR